MAKKLSYRKPVPWIHKQNPLVTSWVWDTPHFIATIFAEGMSAKKMFNWKINDKSTGVPVPFDSSTAKDYNEAAEAILEVVGKAYDRTLGYQDYAGDLATTFTVFDGKRINLAPLIGETISLLIYNEEDENDDIQVTGQFDIRHYDVAVRGDADTLVLINPAYIKSIRKEFYPRELIDEMYEEQQTVSKGRRVFHTEWKKGCTGRPGFKPGTTDHTPNDPFCPVHNI